VVRPLGGSVRDVRVGHHVDIVRAADERKKGAERHEGSTAGVDIVCSVGIRVAVCVVVVGSLRMSFMHFDKIFVFGRLFSASC